MNFPRRQLFRMEEASPANAASVGYDRPADQTAHDGADPTLLTRRTHYRQRKAPDQGAFLERDRSQLDALTAEHQPEVDALSRKPARQDQTIAKSLDRHGGETAHMSEQV